MTLDQLGWCGLSGEPEFGGSEVVASDSQVGVESPGRLRVKYVRHFGTLFLVQDDSQARHFPRKENFSFSVSYAYVRKVCFAPDDFCAGT